MLSVFCLQLKISWQEQYKEWMERTEAKIEELQNTNAMLYVQGGSREGL